MICLSLNHTVLRGTERGRGGLLRGNGGVCWDESLWFSGKGYQRQGGSLVLRTGGEFNIY